MSVRADNVVVGWHNLRMRHILLSRPRTASGRSPGRLVLGCVLVAIALMAMGCSDPLYHAGELDEIADEPQATTTTASDPEPGDPEDEVEESDTEVDTDEPEATDPADAEGDDAEGDDAEDQGSDGDGDPGDAASTEAAAPAPQTATPLAQVVAQLRRNADDFTYAVGEHGGTLTFASIGEPLTFNREVARDSASGEILGYLFEGLTQISWLDDSVEPRLATSWEAFDGGSRWVFNLREDVTWHDGEPFTAHDVEFTFNQVIYNDDFHAASRAAFEFRFVDADTGQWQESNMTVTALDDHTVQFNLPVPLAPFLRQMGTAIYPRHILEPHVEAGTFTEAWGIDTDPGEIIGTGPFSIGEFTPGERIVLKRNPNYWLTDSDGAALPYLDEVRCVVVDDLEATAEAFREGQSDYLGLTAAQFLEFEPLQESGDFTINRRGPGFGSRIFGLNLNPGTNADTGEPFVDPTKLAWFSDLDFRRAVAHAVDRQAIIDDVDFGLGYVQWSSVSPAAGDFHNPAVRQYRYDPNTANAILDGLGWIDSDGDDIREDSDGNPISFTLVTNTGNSVRERVGLVVQQGLTDIGLDVAFELIEFPDLVDRLTTNYDWEAMIVGFSGSPDPHDGVTLWLSHETLHVWHPMQQTPATPWEAEVDRLYTLAGQELDRAARIDLYHQAQEIIAENLPLIYTSLPERLSAVRNTLANTTPTLYGQFDVRYLYRTDL